MRLGRIRSSNAEKSKKKVRMDQTTKQPTGWPGERERGWERNVGHLILSLIAWTLVAWTLVAWHSPVKRHEALCECNKSMNSRLPSHSSLIHSAIDRVFSPSMKEGRHLEGYACTLAHTVEMSFDFPLFGYPCLSLPNPLPLFDRLQNLFSKMLLHSHVPKQFQQGTIVPIVKDCHGNLGDMNNYRGITLAPIISKVYTLKSLFQPFLSTLSYCRGI